MSISKLKKRIYSPEKCELKQSDINHLRKLLAWLSCENQYLATEHLNHNQNAEKLSVVTGAAEQYRADVLAAFHRWPNYVHDAHKALSKTIVQIDSQVTDVASREQKALEVNQ